MPATDPNRRQVLRWSALAAGSIPLGALLAACGSVDYLIFACLAYFVIERYGRRKVMICSAAACSICWIGIAIALGLSERGGDSYVLGSVAVAFFFLFFASFGMGYGSSRTCWRRSYH